MSAIRLFVADDHPIVAQGIERFAELEVDVRVVGTADSVAGLLAALPEAKPDVVSVDLQMPGMLGAATFREIAQRGVPVLLFTLHPADELVASFIRAGVRGYVCKSDTLAAYFAAARRLAAGDTVLPVELTAHMDTSASQAPEVVLTARELEVYWRLGAGDTIKEAAFHLGLSASTVYTHVDRIRAKLSVGSVAEIVRHAARWRVPGSE